MGKALKTVSEKLVKVAEQANVYFYDNGYIVEITGRNKKDDWATVRLLCDDLQEVHTLLLEID